MKIERHEEAIDLVEDDGMRSAELIGATHGGVKGFCMGVAYYEREDYRAPGVHDDQEGFYVLEGKGTAKVGDAEFPVRPGTAFIAGKGVPHTIRRDPDSPPVKVLWAHGAV